MIGRGLAAAKGPQRKVRTRGLLHAVAAGAVLWLTSAMPAQALSEFQIEDMQPPTDPDEVIEREPLPPPRDLTIPLPDPIRPPLPVEEGRFGEVSPEAELPVADILYDLDLLPEPVRETRRAIMEASLTGEIEELRPLLAGIGEPTQVSLSSVPDDPVEYLRDLSGDEGGQEILAILYEILTAGFVHLDDGGVEEMYVWPYFFAVPLEGLTAPQRVELFKLVTAGDYEDMKAYGGYIFYRAGIAPDGRWAFFLAGH